MPKYVVSRLRRASVPHFTACRAVVQAKFNCNWNKFPNADITEPAALLYASYRPSLNLRAGSVWFGVTNEGVVRVRLNDVDQRKRGDARSEEHTSELQSRGHLVCRLLLEKKKDL